MNKVKRTGIWAFLICAVFVGVVLGIIAIEKNSKFLMEIADTIGAVAAIVTLFLTRGERRVVVKHTAQLPPPPQVIRLSGTSEASSATRVLPNRTPVARPVSALASVGA